MGATGRRVPDRQGDGFQLLPASQRANGNGGLRVDREAARHHQLVRTTMTVTINGSDYAMNGLTTFTISNGSVGYMLVRTDDSGSTWAAYGPEGYFKRPTITVTGTDLCPVQDNETADVCRVCARCRTFGTFLSPAEIGRLSTLTAAAPGQNWPWERMERT